MTAVVAYILGVIIGAIWMRSLMREKEDSAIRKARFWFQEFEKLRQRKERDDSFDADWWKRQ